MGQQQLLLIILVTIIVGIATVVAINVFGSGAEQANRDAVRMDMLTVTTGSEGFYIKPQMMGGGGRSYDDFTLREVSGLPTTGIDGTDLIGWNDNGKYILTPGADTFTLVGHPASSSPPRTAAEIAANDPPGDSTDPITVVVTRDADNRVVLTWTQ